MKSIRAIVAAIALAVVVVPGRSPAAETLPKLGGVQALKTWFNAAKGHPRLIFLLSPT